MEFRPVGAEFIQSEAEGGTDMTDIIGAFGEWANAPQTSDNFWSISFPDFLGPALQEFPSDKFCIGSYFSSLW
jgi:hypothetical protein